MLPLENKSLWLHCIQYAEMCKTSSIDTKLELNHTIRNSTNSSPSVKVSWPESEHLKHAQCHAIFDYK